MNIDCRVLCVSFIPEEFRVLVKDAVNDIGLVRKVLSMVGTIDVVDSSILYSLNGKSKLSLKDARVLFESVERAFSILGFGYNFEQAIKSSDDSGKGYYTLFETTYRNSRKLYCYPLNDNDRKTESRERSYRIYTLLKCLAVYSYCVNSGVQPTIHHLELIDQYIYFYSVDMRKKYMVVENSWGNLDELLVLYDTGKRVDSETRVLFRNYLLGVYKQTRQKNDAFLNMFFDGKDIYKYGIYNGWLDENDFVLKDAHDKWVANVKSKEASSDGIMNMRSAYVDLIVNGFANAGKYIDKEAYNKKYGDLDNDIKLANNSNAEFSMRSLKQFRRDIFEGLEPLIERKKERKKREEARAKAKDLEIKQEWNELVKEVSIQKMDDRLASLFRGTDD